MKSENLYESIMNKGVTAIENNKEYVDSLIEDKTDTRMGITLAIRPPKNLKKKITNIEMKIREVEMELLRQRLRQSILDNNMNLDERYPTISSHITIARFKNKIEERKRLIEILKEYENYDFGTFKVSEIELIYHNWYDSKKEVLEKYRIK